MHRIGARPLLNINAEVVEKLFMISSSEQRRTNPAKNPSGENDQPTIIATII